MQKFMKKRKTRGFTLVELLIVIIIIGILAGALLLVAGAGTDKANATKIVSDMRGIKTAAIMKYADDGDWDWANNSTAQAAVKDLKDYLDRDPSESNLVSYDVVTEEGFVWVEAGNIEGTATTGIREKLKNMASDSGLYAAPDSADQSNEYTGESDTVYMLIK